MSFPSTKRIAHLAKRTVVMANSSSPVSVSRMDQYGDFYEEQLYPSHDDKERHMDNVADVMRNPRKFIDKYPAARTSFDILENIVLHCLKYSTANCAEMSMFCYLLFHYAICRGEVNFSEAEMFFTEGRSHVFLVITPQGDNPLPRGSFSASDHCVKSSKSIVCDPWMKSVFLKKIIQNTLEMKLCILMIIQILDIPDSIHTTVLKMTP
ncbi:MAG: hypothetical protein GY750_10310 [Lentisphaerae bacterium]|nr:hypothetical protein [Lentisphaerota bacterium]MCP4101803.1 hypothetical protein [Lentisphaerota bacterium]